VRRHEANGERPRYALSRLQSALSGSPVHSSLLLSLSYANSDIHSPEQGEPIQTSSPSLPYPAPSLTLPHIQIYPTTQPVTAIHSGILTSTLLSPCAVFPLPTLPLPPPTRPPITHAPCSGSRMCTVTAGSGKTRRGTTQPFLSAPFSWDNTVRLGSHLSGPDEGRVGLRAREVPGLRREGREGGRIGG